MYAFVIALFLGACSTLELSVGSALPDVNQTRSITVFALDNYTDTPQAGMRASNLIEGVLLAQGYTVVNAVSIQKTMFKEKLEFARQQGSEYFITGGVSEWRYKTGIDGEPAVSIHLKMIEVSSSHVVWNATASSNDWGNASIGTTAQSMIEAMFERE